MFHVKHYLKNNLKNFLKNFKKIIDNSFICDIMNTDRENRKGDPNEKINGLEQMLWF